MIKSPLPKSAYQKNSRIYKILANPKRLEILNLLRVRELSVDDLTEIMGINKANASQHLSILRHTGLVHTRRSGQSIYYSICDAKIVEPCKIFHNLRIKNSIL